MTNKEILEDLSAVALNDPADAIGKQLYEFTKEQLIAIRSYSRKPDGSITVKFRDKLKALRDLGKFHDAIMKKCPHLMRPTSK